MNTTNDTEWYENGRIKLEGTYKDGKKNGLWKIWYENGQMESRCNYKDGKKEGCQTDYHEKNGGLKSLKNYKDGKLHESTTYFYEHGQMESECNYKNGKKEGLSITWWDGYKVEEVTYKNGVRNGSCKTWFKKGQTKKKGHVVSIELMGNYKNDQKDGVFLRWDIYGNKGKEIWKEDVLVDEDLMGLKSDYYAVYGDHPEPPEPDHLYPEPEYSNGDDPAF